MKTARDDEQYVTFSDASLLDARYGSGGTQIWYAKPAAFRELSFGAAYAAGEGVLPKPRRLEDTHVYIGNVNESNPEKVFDMMQGEKWSPHGQASSLSSIRACRHTSMSVGDVLVINRDTLMVDLNGFYDLETDQRKTASARRVARIAMYGHA